MRGARKARASAPSTMSPSPRWCCLPKAPPRNILVVDLDVHQGDGTADILRDEPRVFTFSMHGERNYPVRKIASDLDVALPDGTGDAAYLDRLGRHPAGTVRARRIGTSSSTMPASTSMPTTGLAGCRYR